MVLIIPSRRASRVEVEAMLEDCEMDGRELEVWWEIQLQCFIVSWESEGGVVGLGVREEKKNILH